MNADVYYQAPETDVYVINTNNNFNWKYLFVILIVVIIIIIIAAAIWWFLSGECTFPLRKLDEDCTTDRDCDETLTCS